MHSRFVFTDWYHADALEIDESKLFQVQSFKCCKCRRIKSPECPYSDKKSRTQEGTKKHRRFSKKGNSSSDNLGVISEPKECEPATPNFPMIDDGFGQDSDPLLYSLSSSELMTDPNAEIDVTRNAVSGPCLGKLPVRRQVKREGDGDDSFASRLSHVDYFTQNGTGSLSAVEKESSPLEYDPAICLDSDLLNDCGNEQYDEYTDHLPQTVFSLKELLQPDDDQFDGADLSGDFSGYLENDMNMECILEDSVDFSLVDNEELAAYPPGSGYSCCQCSQMEPAPDLSCEICGIWIHSQCSPWVELPWRCGNCREWQ